MIIRINWKKIVLFLFFISILFPPGFGIRIDPSYPGIDMQRLSILFIFLIFPIYLLKKDSFNNKLLINTRTELLLLSIILINVISIITVESFFGSLLWSVGNTFLYFGYAFIIIFILTNEKIELMEFTKIISSISIILILWSVLETILQTNLITYRNMYRQEIVELYSNLKRLWIMPIGPYVYVKALAMALILFGPISYIYKKKTNSKYPLIWFLLFLISIISVQTLSAILGILVMFVLLTLYYSKIAAFFSFCGILGALFLLYLFLPTSFIEEINTSPNSAVCCNAVDYYFHYYLFDHPIGSVSARLSQLYLLFTNWFESGRLLFGWGSGSMADPLRVPTSVFDYDKYKVTDIYPGSFFVWFLETGLFVGTFIFFIFARAIIKGLKSHNDILIFMSISLTGYFVMMLSTINTKIFGPALVIAGLIDYFSKKRDFKLE